LSMDQKRRF